MREIRHTFEHLVVIAVVIFAVLLIVFSIPGVRSWIFNNVPAAAVSLAGTGAVSSMMVGVDPHLLATAVNDDETRAELIDLWKKSIPEMEPDAMADAINQLMADPNVSTTVVDVIAELDEEKVTEFYNTLLSDPAVADHIATVISKLDVQGLSNLSNHLMACEGTADLIVGLINNADDQATATLVNKILSNPQTVDGLNEMIGYLDADTLYKFSSALLAKPETAQLINGLIDIFVKAAENGEASSKALSDLMNQMLANPNTPKLVNALIDNSDSTKVADLVQKIMENPNTAAGINKLIEVVDPSVVSNLVNQVLTDNNGDLSDFVQVLINNSDSGKVASLVNEILGNEQTVKQLDRVCAGLNSETIGRFLSQLLGEPGTVNLLRDLLASVEVNGVLADLLNNGNSGIKDVLWGQPGVDDAVLDWLWVEIKLEYAVTENGLGVVEYWEQYLHTLLDPMALGWLAPTLAQFIGAGQWGYTDGSYQYVRVSDLFFGSQSDFSTYIANRQFPAHI